MNTFTQIDTPRDSGWHPRKLSGYMNLIGPLWARQENAGWAYGLLATQQHLNPAGIVHGGLLATLLDHSLSLIAWEGLGRETCVTVQMDTQFLSAARDSQFIEARGRIVRATSSLVFMQGHLSHADRTIASASALLKRLALPKPVAADP